MIETWLPIAGFFDYEISSFGRVKSLKRTARVVSRTGNEFNINIKERILKQGICKKNNKIRCNFVILRKNNKSCIKKVHRLVLQSFVGFCPDIMEGCHNDGNPLNNHIDNLRWDTRSSNHADKRIHGTAFGNTGAKGDKHHRAKFKEQDIREIRTALFHDKLYDELAFKYNASRQTIWRIHTNRSWTHI